MNEIHALLHCLRNTSQCGSIARQIHAISLTAIQDSTSPKERKALLNFASSLCGSSSLTDVWCGINILYVLALDKSSCLTYGSGILDILISVMKSPEFNNKIIIKASLRCLLKVTAILRGDSVLTREVITPKLSLIIDTSLHIFDTSPSVVADALGIFVKSHPTTCRPYLTKIRSKLVEIIATKEYYDSSRWYSLLALLSIILMAEKENPQAHWGNFTNNLIGEILATVLILENFLTCSSDSTLKPLLDEHRASDATFLCAPLKIEVDSSSSIMQIARRLRHLLTIFTLFLVSGTDDLIQIPVGKIIQMVNAICSVNFGISEIRPQFRDNGVKSSLNVLLRDIQNCSMRFGSSVLNTIGGFFIPYSARLLETINLNAKSFIGSGNHNVCQTNYVEASLLFVGLLISLEGHFLRSSEISSILSLTTTGVKIFGSKQNSLNDEVTISGREATFACKSLFTNPQNLCSSISIFYEIMASHSFIPQETFCSVFKDFTERAITLLDFCSIDNGDEMSRFHLSVINMSKHSAAPIALMRSLDLSDQLSNAIINPILPNQKLSANLFNSGNEATSPRNSYKRSLDLSLEDITNGAKKLKPETFDPDLSLSKPEVKLQNSSLAKTEKEIKPYTKLISFGSSTHVQHVDEADSEGEQDIEIPSLVIGEDSDAET